MRRKDREIQDLEQLESILKECSVVRIAAQDEDGLFIVPVNFGYRLEGEKLTLLIHSAMEGRKVSPSAKGARWPLRWTADTPCAPPTPPAATATPTGASWARAR